MLSLVILAGQDCTSVAFHFKGCSAVGLWYSQADKSRVKDYIHRLDNFDGPAVAEIAVGYQIFEEAFEIYKKFGLKTQAIKVLLEHQEDLDRALEYALKVRHAVPAYNIDHSLDVPCRLFVVLQKTRISSPYALKITWRGKLKCQSGTLPAVFVGWFFGICGLQNMQHVQMLDCCCRVTSLKLRAWCAVLC